ncbi:type IA DNA topoisomerase [Desulfosporosinus meridiei]|uniref:DNA topoisomerase n=1 Tax=Desulfosporosinus meridiei (strain ATCC BAA-275 / DSM 13257 / KCTC 12902 / NCIMB 13706 / S10) TaxID=768704 RepID=J7IPS7_DESMD|nr:type IA DNA topoisomerase [Desulfosporosinus meridiei]AFQ43635.1 DNA topoisomerase III [Desulfosporosinus meridiei DSM 13257]
MIRKLIIAEKPSQAREYAAALGVKKRGDGFLENESYVITWCYGHLLELERPEAYMDLDRVGKRWSLKRLPVLPKLRDFRRVVKSGAEKQFKVIQQWLKSSDIGEVICGTDADREGQLLFQEVWDASKCNKPLSRLWISSLTNAAILEGLKSLRPGESMAGLAAAGNGRAYADWDFGMNLTEGFSSLFGSFDAERKKPNVISIGRVQTPTLALIVEREWEIEQFVTQRFFEVKAEFTTLQGGYPGKWFDLRDDSKRITDPQVAETIVAKTQGKQGEILRIEQKDVQEPAPLLFDLTSLSIAASKKYGYSAEKVLQLAQSLYEKKAITYPRTDCAYLSTDILPKLPDHLRATRQEPYTNLVDEAAQFGLPKGKRVINTITAHHAIIPTTEKVALDRLNRDEQNLYDLILRRFLAVWFPPAQYHQTDVVTMVEDEAFRTKGKVLLSLGWKKVYGSSELNEESEGKSKKKLKQDQTEDESVALPPLSKGEDVKAKRVFIEEKSTKPPKRFTQGDLLKAMEGAGKQIDDEILRQQLKGKGLGTVATRPAIIESLIDRGYILQDHKILRPTEKGVELIKVIKEKLPQAQLLISAEMTGQMEFDLSKVERGELTIEHYMTEVEEAIVRILQELRSFEQRHGKTPLALAPSSKNLKKGKEVKESGKKDKTKPVEESPVKRLGNCPKCGGEIIEGQKGFGCSNWREGCRFVLWKTPICGKVLTVNQVKSLLKKGRTPLIKGFKSKSGKTFAAYLIWEDQLEAKLKFEIENS